MEVIKQNIVVRLKFSLHTTTGNLVDGGDDFSYIHGYGRILSGMESALEGKSKGDTVHIELAPEDAFGAYVEQEPIQVHRRDFGKNFDKLYEGMGLPIQNSNGEDILIYVQKKVGSFVTLSRNHPLAGESLVFDANILEVRCASTDEVMKKSVLDSQVSNSGGSCSCC